MNGRQHVNRAVGAPHPQQSLEPHQPPRQPRRLDAGSLIWGLLFAAVAGLGLWVGTGHRLDWRVLRWAAPAYLILLGVLGLALSRRPSSPSTD